MHAVGRIAYDGTIPNIQASWVKLGAQGVQQLLDIVVDCLPSPLDRPPVQGIHPKTKDVVTLKPDASEPASALDPSATAHSGCVSRWN